MTPEEYAGVAVAYVNAVGWEDGEYGGSSFDSKGGYHPAYQRLREAVAESVRTAIAEEREACAKIADDYLEDWGPALMEVMVNGKEIAKRIRARST